ncbi:homoserine kinase [Litoribacillus peritrichatus]|uniref:Homoserine kinase n=1 Tax=Litoribacillus peritrichatus TaxID=718191 RepID=A0ABP7NC53_9GAMM
MSVYTQLDQQDFEYISQAYQLGTPIEFKGVADGIENTTYFFKTQKDHQINEWVFTLFEYTQPASLPYYLELYDHLYQGGVPVPDPLLNKAGHRLITLHDKPGAVFPRLPGRPPEQITTELCFQCGAGLARFHQVGESYPQQHACPKGLAFWQASVHAFSNLPDDDVQLIQSVISDYLSVCEGLPKTSVHGDLFADNVLVNEGKLTAIIDLFNASYDLAVFDLAITLNDWAYDDRHQCDGVKYQAMLDGYQSLRPLSAAEQTALPIMQQAAALRFWLSRIDTEQTFQQHQNDGHISTKDPNAMKYFLISLQTTRNATED